jgi:hypothetical protein
MIADYRDGSLVITLDTDTNDVQYMLDIMKYWNNRFHQPSNFQPVSHNVINFLKEYV